MEDVLYLDSIVVHNFKSFKHTSVKFKKGYNCIVGPNGSGKSNVVDSILFALGEHSLKRMRVGKADQLINATAKRRDDGTKRAYVKLVFSGDTNAEIMRIIKSNGKIGYKINGKTATRQEVVDFLRSYRSSADETNVIAQGEINKMQNLNARERRELIDIAAGIREFDEKKNASLKELEKVDTKVREAQIELGLKKGFLADIEKQKDDAESYMRFKDYVTRGTFTILKTRETEVAAQFESASRDIKAIDDRIAKINGETLRIEGELSGFSSDRTALIKELNEKSIETSSASRKLEEVEKEIAVKETESRSVRDRVKEREAHSESQIGQLDALREKIEKQRAEIDRVKAALKERKSDKGMERIAQLAASQGGADSLLELYGKTQKEMFALQEKLSVVSSDAAGLDAQARGLEQQIDSISKETESVNAEIRAAKDRLVAAEREGEKLNREADASRKKLSSGSGTLAEARKRIDDIDVKALTFKEQLAMTGAGDRRADEELRRTLKTGYYGRAHELCSYEEKYEAAVAAAAGNRLNYFVVDSAEVAEKAIELIKSKKLGRAAFIPLADIIVSDRQQNAKFDALISHMEYDGKYSKAFRYIFSDTYIIDNIREAKSAGFGKGRFVTYGGELVETSGIISGGDSGRRMSPSLLQSKINALQRDRESAVTAMRDQESNLDALKRLLSETESKLITNSLESRNIGELSGRLEERAMQLGARCSAFKEQLESARLKAKKGRDEEAKLSKEIERLGKTADEALKRSKALEGQEEREKEIASYKAAMEEVERLKISLAEMQKESEMELKSSEKLDAEVQKTHEQVKDDRRRLAILDEEIRNLGKDRVELGEEIKVRGAKHGALITKMNKVDEAIAKAGEAKGKWISEMSRAEREVAEIGARKAQSQMRLADIRAELASYQNVEPVIGEEIKQVEERVQKSKFEIEKLGAVNLKAPEAFKERSEEVAKAEEKMSILATEKEAILNLIKEIDARKLSVFKDTFSQVNENYKKLHGYIFGGSASLQLDSQKDPLESGLNIVIQEGRNKNMLVEQFSGGEKTLLVLMLLFAIQMRTPQAFYMFDEIDVSLDKENAKKLSKLLSELSRSSQLIVVSHNDTMITAADTAIGVVRRAGESAVVGLQMSSDAGQAQEGA
ncbi:MAG: chromosome segregation protein SMC [Candidatus Micrarchaeota archaeon]|nr:chromosome segregation protein SMC [Candidatus Micrarchaeota archaeon]